MLRTRLSCLGLLLMLLWPALSLKADAQNPSDKDAAVRAVLSNFVDVWNNNQLRTSFGPLFTDDADFVVISGTYLKGRDEIVAHHVKIREGVYGDSRLVWNPVHIRFIRPDVAVAQVATEITFGKEKRNTFATVVLVHQDAKWLITAMENTLVFDPDAPPK